MAKMRGYDVTIVTLSRGTKLYLQTRYPDIQNLEKLERKWLEMFVNQECSGNSKSQSLNQQ